MIEAASLGVGVGWQDAGAVRGMKDLQREVADTARTSNSQMKLMEQGAKNALGSMGKMLSGLGIGLGLAAIGGAAIKLGKELVRAGSDAEEMLGKFNVVMGAQADAVTEQLAAFGAAVGRSKFDLMEMAAGVQDTFVPLGFARDEASKMSVTLTQLATDVASFNNASDPEVMNAFTSAIVGNHEAVRQYGIIITEATLNTELLAMGIEKGTKGASEQEKVQARLNLIMKGTSDAQGDAARTSGSWANTMRGLRGLLSDTAAEIGLKLLPVLSPLLQNFTTFARETMPEVIRSVSDAIVTLSALNDTVQRFDYQRLVTGLDETGRRATTFSEQIGGFLANLAAWGDVIFGVLGDKLALTGQQIATIGDLITGKINWDDFKQRLAEIATQFDAVDAAGGRVAQGIYDNIGKFDEMVAGFVNVRQATVDATEAWAGYDAAMHSTAASDAAAEMATNVADSLSQLWEQVLPADEEGWATYLEQMTTAMTDSSSLLSEHSETQLGLIEEWGTRRAELALQEQEAVAALEATGQEDSAARLSEYFDTMMGAIDDQYQARIDAEANAMGTLQDLQAGAMGTLLENFSAYAMDAAQRNAEYAQNIVDLEQGKADALAYMEYSYQNQAAALQATGQAEKLNALKISHSKDLVAVATYYDSRIKGEKTAQNALLTNSKTYYLTILNLARIQLGSLLRGTKAIANEMIKDNAKQYGSMIGHILAYNAAIKYQLTEIPEVTSIINSTIAAMNAISGGAIDAVNQASAGFDAWKDGLGDVGDGLDDVGNKLDGIGGSAGGSGGVKEKITDPIKEAADTAQRLAQMVDKAIAAFDVLAEYGGPSPGWVTGYRKLLEAVEVMVTMFAATTKRIFDMGLLAEEKREELGSAVDVIGGTLKVISEALKVSQMFEDVEDQTANVSAILDRLTTDIYLMVRKIMAISETFAKLGDDKLRDAARASEYLVEIMKPWSEAVKAVSALVTLPAIDAQEFIDRTVEQMTALALGMVEVGKQVDRTEMRQAAQAADGILDALKPWEPAVKAISAIVTAPTGNIGEQTQKLMTDMILLVQTLVDAQDQIDKEALKESAKSASLLIDALKPWEAAAKVVSVIANSTWERIGPQAEKLIGQMFNLIRKLSLHSADVDRTELERLGRLAQPLIDALKPWEAAAKAVEAIADSTWERIGPRAEKLVGQMFNLIRKLSLHSANVNQAELERLGRLAQPLIDALKPWEAAAKAVDAIAGAAVGRIGPAAEVLVNQMLGLVRKLARIAGQIRPEDLSASADAAALFVQALKPWEVAAEAVDAISRTKGERIGPQAERLVNQMMGLARKLARVAQEMPAGQLQEAARAAALFSESLKPWEQAMTAVEALSKFANTARIGPQAERLVQQMMGLARKLARAGREVGLSDLEFAARVGRLFGDVLEPWNKAITLSNELRMWRELPDLQERMTRFVRIWVDIVADLSNAVSVLSSGGMQAVAEFGRTLADLMGGLQSALDFATEFEFVLPNVTMWDNFFDWVFEIFEQFRAEIERRYPEDEDFAPVAAWAGALSSLMSGLQSALDLAADFVFVEPDATMWNNFFTWVFEIFEDFRAEIVLRYPEDEDFAPVAAWAGALSSLMSGLQGALAIARDFEFQTPDATQWDNFFTWVTGVFQAFYTDIITRYPPEDPTATFAPVAAWGGALGALMGGLQSALTLAKDFEFQEPPEDQWNAFFDWTTLVFSQFNTAITTEYPTEDPTATFAPVAAWGGALGALMGGLQSALGVASGFQFTEPPEDQWNAFFAWTTAVFTDFETAINTAYPIDDPEGTFAPVTAWANAFGALMGGLQAAIDLVHEFDWQEPPEDQWDEFMAWSLAVLTSFRDTIIEDYPDANAATWAPVVAWSGALTALMQALQAAVTTADSFAFIPPDELGWDNFFTWVFRVFDQFRLEVLRLLPENPQEAGLFPAVIALSDAISAIFSGLQSALSFFMDLHGPGEAFWTFLGGAGGNPDTSPFAQRMGYVIGAITGTMAAFDAWVVTNAPTWTGNANTLLTKVTEITGILSDAIQLFDFMANTTLPSTADIQLFVTAVLQLFSSFAGELTNLTGEGGIGSHVNAIATTVSGFVATTMPPQILNWTQAGSDLVGGFASGMASMIGPATVTGTVSHAIAAIQSALGEFTGWWAGPGGAGSNAGPGWYYWYDAGDALVDAFIEGMESNLGNPEGAVYNAAFAIGQAANSGLEAGAASGGSAGGGGYRPEGPTAGLGKAAAGTFGWSSPSVSSERNINVTIRFENAPANLDRRTLDELKRTLVYEIQRGS